MASKDRQLKARLPRGLADRTAADIRATERMVATIRQVYERYGFEPVETPLIEYTDALGKFLPDQDRPNEGVFSFQDDDPQEARSGGAATGKKGEWLSLRYDLTAPLARYVAENFDQLPKPYRSYRAGWVFRNEKPGPGRFRQFMQFDADTVGASSPAADAEICMMAADTMEALGIQRGQYVIKVNSRKVLDGGMDAVAIPEDLRLKVLRNVDKTDRLGPQAVWDLNKSGRKDESGDFTPGAGLPDAANSAILGITSSSTTTVINFEGEFIRISPSAEVAAVISKNFMDPVKSEDDRIVVSGGSVAVRRDEKVRRLEEGLQDLDALRRIFESCGYNSDRIRIDTSVVRGLEYYTGPVFEAELLFEIPNEKGQPVVFGSVGGGGRYDGLVGRFRGEDVPATGFSIGVSRLQAALTALGKVDTADSAGPVVVTVMEPERIADYQRMVTSLRNAGIAAELYLGSGRFGAQMKYADRRKAPLAIIQGSDEKTKGVVQIKDLALGKKLSEGLADNTAWREERPGQFEVPEAELVAAVLKMVEARH